MCWLLRMLACWPALITGFRLLNGIVCELFVVVVVAVRVEEVKPMLLFVLRLLLVLKLLLKLLLVCTLGGLIPSISILLFFIMNFRR